MKKNDIRNPDSKDLGPLGNDHFTVGYIDEINGPGSVEVPIFVATRHELQVLAKHWAGVDIDLAFSWFVTQQTGSREIRIGPFACRRLARIADALGEEPVAEAVRVAEEEFGKKIDPKTWEIFLRGTPEQRQALQNEIGRQMSGIEDPQQVARITALMKSLNLEYPVAEEGKAVRLAILPFKCILVSDPPCLVLPIFHYVNADADGHYRIEHDGSLPPIEWEIRHLGLSPLEIKNMLRLPDPQQSAYDIDLVMSRLVASDERTFHRASNKSRWKLNPELVIEVEKAGLDSSNSFVAKIRGKADATIFEDFLAAWAAMG